MSGQLPIANRNTMNWLSPRFERASLCSGCRPAEIPIYREGLSALRDVNVFLMVQLDPKGFENPSGLQKDQTETRTSGFTNESVASGESARARRRSEFLSRASAGSDPPTAGSPSPHPGDAIPATP